MLLIENYFTSSFWFTYMYILHTIQSVYAYVIHTYMKYIDLINLLPV